jgi:hypothetical protein
MLGVRGASGYGGVRQVFGAGVVGSGVLAEVGVGIEPHRFSGVVVGGPAGISVGCEVEPGLVHRVGEGVGCGVADEAAACLCGVEDEGDVEAVCGAVQW